MARKKSAPADSDCPSFEESLAQLESIVTELESGELGLADSLARYEDGVQRIQRCHQMLQEAERRIAVLSGVDADGNPFTRVYDDAPCESLEAKAESRARRRTSKADQRPDVDDSLTLF